MLCIWAPTLTDCNVGVKLPDDMVGETFGGTSPLPLRFIQESSDSSNWMNVALVRSISGPSNLSGEGRGISDGSGSHPRKAYSIATELLIKPRLFRLLDRCSWAMRE